MVAAAVAASVGSAVIGGVTSMSAANTASGAAKDAAALQAEQFATTRGDLLPYNTAGQAVLGDLTSLAQSGPYGGGKNYLAMAEQNLPLNMTQAQLEATPGYQFTRDQGLKATQSAAAARGLGVSGAALKGAATYATGLADSTYTNRFNEAQTRYSDIFNLNTGQQTNLQNQFNRLSGVASLGESAAAQTGALGTAAAKTEGQGLMSAGGYQAAGIQGVGNSVNSGISNYLQQNALSKYTGSTQGYGNMGYQPQQGDPYTIGRYTGSG